MGSVVRGNKFGVPKEKFRKSKRKREMIKKGIELLIGKGVDTSHRLLMTLEIADIVVPIIILGLIAKLLQR